MGEVVELRGWVGMGEAVDTIPSILNKCLFVSPDRQTDARGKIICLPTLADRDIIMKLIINGVLQ